MRRIKTICLLLLLCTGSLQAAQVNGLRVWESPDSTRLVFDTDGPVEHSVFILTNPFRVIIDLKDTRLAASIGSAASQTSAIRSIRSGIRNGTDARVVLDMQAPVRPQSFVLRPNQTYGHRLVLDLLDTTADNSKPATVTRSAPVTPDAPRPLIIAIDAGHGGEDPGAIGRSGTREKDVVLSISRQLYSMINAEPGMQAVMIRTGDYYVGLRERMIKARQAKADLFISVHADSFSDRRAHGSSVYVLSQRGASSASAQFLADSENNSDLIGGVSLTDKDDLLASVLIDLSQNATLAASLDVAGGVLKELRGVGHLHKHRVEQAGFVVLKSPDVPSILVETGFISNPSEERKLRDKAHQTTIARAVLNGVRNYFSENAPPGTVYAQRGQRHVIQRGETLSAIAQRYSISLQDLRSVNGLRSDLLEIGQELTIPAISGG
jgi:N-acetylmuramoyl-L-alanine amidase